MGNRWDFTPEQWFKNKKTTQNSNFLIEVVPNFDYLQAFGQNSLDRVIHYLGHSEYFDRYTGYVLKWDGKHCCDRCGKALRITGCKTVNMAYLIKINPSLTNCGVCSECDLAMHKESLDKNLVEKYSLPSWWESKPIPNCWDQYAWL